MISYRHLSISMETFAVYPLHETTVTTHSVHPIIPRMLKLSPKQKKDMSVNVQGKSLNQVRGKTWKCGMYPKRDITSI